MTLDIPPANWVSVVDPEHCSAVAKLSNYENARPVRKKSTRKSVLSKLTAEQKQEILRAYVNGMSSSQIAGPLAISVSMARKIILGLKNEFVRRHRLKLEAGFVHSEESLSDLRNPKLIKLIREICVLPDNAERIYGASNQTFCVVPLKLSSSFRKDLMRQYISGTLTCVEVAKRLEVHPNQINSIVRLIINDVCRHTKTAVPAKISELRKNPVFWSAKYEQYERMREVKGIDS